MEAIKTALNGNLSRLVLRFEIVIAYTGAVFVVAISVFEKRMGDGAV